MVVRIKKPASALASKNVILTGKGVSRVKDGEYIFDRCPYEVAEKQWVPPSTVKNGAPDYVDVYVGKVGETPAPELDLCGVYQIEVNPASGVEFKEILRAAVVDEEEPENNVIELALVRLKKVEFLRNAGV